MNQLGTALKSLKNMACYASIGEGNHRKKSRGLDSSVRIDYVFYVNDAVY